MVFLSRKRSEESDKVLTWIKDIFESETVIQINSQDLLDLMRKEKPEGVTLPLWENRFMLSTLIGRHGRDLGIKSRMFVVRKDGKKVAERCYFLEKNENVLVKPNKRKLSPRKKLTPRERAIKIISLKYNVPTRQISAWLCVKYWDLYSMEFDEKQFDRLTTLFPLDEVEKNLLKNI